MAWSSSVLVSSAKVTWKLRAILSQIAGSLVLPLLVTIFVAESMVDIHEYRLVRDAYMSGGAEAQPLPQSVTRSLLHKGYTIFILAFSLLPTSAVVYTVGSSYASGREMSYRRTMSAVPRLWRRLAATLSSVIAIFLPADVPVRMSFGMWVKARHWEFGPELLAVLVIAYVAGLVYVAAVWQMASVVTVMEEEGVAGLRAVRKAFRLTRGRKVVVVCQLAVMSVLALVYRKHTSILLLRDNEDDRWIELAGCALVSMVTVVFGTVVQTVVYVEYHHRLLRHTRRSYLLAAAAA